MTDVSGCDVSPHFLHSVFTMSRMWFRPFCFLVSFSYRLMFQVQVAPESRFQ